MSIWKKQFLDDHKLKSLICIFHPGCDLKAYRQDLHGGLNFFRALKEISYHFISALPQVSPPPKTGRQIKSPFLILPTSTASAREIAHEAEEILPYF